MRTGSIFRKAILATVTGGLVTVQLVAGETAWRYAPLTSDIALTQRVEAAIGADAMLHSARLVISVVDGVAVVGGPVDSVQAQQRLTQIVRQVPGLRDAKISTWTSRPERRAAWSSAPYPTPSLSVPQLASAVIPNPDPRTGGRIVSQRFTLPPLLLEPVVRQQPATTPLTTPSAYSPLPPPAPPAPNGPPQFPTIPPPAVPVVPRQDVAAAVETVRSASNRFGTLQADVRSGVVTITGTAPDAADAWELANQLRKVPGVDRVIVGQVIER
jgi:osmotically-inducible protein OsmY